ncbi:ComF family protein [Clostridium sp. MT-14]|jgi:competence protein ComFC|uniref:ComF family protein n=1 Tax=Clostridium aromativorans TaxID=2836848 RepID=A0ABS8N1G8_9CLOT|nr:MULTISPECIES: ComF family protein [Clostridium]KAA8667263.1 ComF family protein [Clostridium sp. HV4-5-A1G]MCC9293648.1 ComF family protein [Clostridium aromativorans]CAB1253930.1 DNA utilization protein GntX [Clostridiaceae bacterium BL-3]
MGYGFVENLAFLWDCVLGLIYCNDEKCVLCKKDIYDGENICRTCKDNIKICRDRFQIESNNCQFNCYSSSYYSGAMMELIIKLKYKNSFKSGDIIASYMKDTICNNNIHFDVLTYVPMTRKSFKKRGYNQGEYLARTLGKHFRKPVVHCLTKTKDTMDQIGLSREERWNNIYGSFKVYNSCCIKGKSVLLVDDVLTTGATAFCCGSELLKNGAKKINILTGAKSRV